MTEKNDRREDVVVAFRKWLRNYSGSNWARLTGPERELVLNMHTKRFIAKLPEPLALGKTVKNKIKEKIGKKISKW